MGGRAPLEGVHVVALEQAVSAPLCTRHLADLGADVVKLERSGEGDLARHYDSVVDGHSAYFVWLNRGKRSVTVDLKAPFGQRVVAKLLGRADVFVHNLGPGAVDRLGLGWADMHAQWPSLISCAISGYGMDGPYRDRKAFDLLVQGEAGLLAITGSPEQPAKVGISIADLCAGMYALSAVLAALYDRVHTGLGKQADISMFESLAEWMTPPLYHQLYAGQAPGRAGMRHNMIVPYGPYRARDGALVNLAVQNENQWIRLCDLVLGRAELARDRRFKSNELRVTNRSELEPTIEGILSGFTAAELELKLHAADIPYGHVNSVAELANHPQLAARNRWFDVDCGNARIPALAHPFNISGLDQNHGAVPTLGQHTQEVLAELALDEPT